jgi:alpha-tubulin suppressor-like RCC1 family protein
VFGYATSLKKGVRNMEKKKFLVASLGLVLAGLLIACGDADNPGTGLDQRSGPVLQSISSKTIIPPVTGWSSITAGGSHTCGIDSNTYLWCWGGNEYGQLGNGSTTDQKIPQNVGTNTGWMQVSAGAEFTCGLWSPGSIWCFGDNTYGQVGRRHYCPAVDSGPGGDCHQLDFARHLEKEGKVIAVYDVDKLEETLRKIDSQPLKLMSDKKLVNALRKYIEIIERGAIMQI